MGTRKKPGHHRQILAALKSADEVALRQALRNDVTLGLRLLTI